MNTASKTYRHILAILLSVIACASSYAADTAASVMNRCASKLNSSGSCEVDFIVHGQQDQISGTLTMEQAYFRMDTPQVKVWYDGRTQWTMLASSQEVSITEPTAAELMETNPFTVLNSYASHYKAMLVKSPSGKKAVQLTPLTGSPSGIKKAVVTVDASSWLPTALVVTFTDGNEIRAEVSEVTFGKKLPVSSFRYDEKLFPASEIIDLR